MPLKIYSSSIERQVLRWGQCLFPLPAKGSLGMAPFGFWGTWLRCRCQGWMRVGCCGLRIWPFLILTSSCPWQPVSFFTWRSRFAIRSKGAVNMTYNSIARGRDRRSPINEPNATKVHDIRPSRPQRWLRSYTSSVRTTFLRRLSSPCRSPIVLFAPKLGSRIT